ncbi:MAG: hypothetical protein ACI4F8_10360 [Lachnospiraceae bacterium]
MVIDKKGYKKTTRAKYFSYSMWSIIYPHRHNPQSACTYDKSQIQTLIFRHSIIGKMNCQVIPGVSGNNLGIDQSPGMMYNNRIVLGGLCMLSVVVMEKIAK